MVALYNEQQQQIEGKRKNNLLGVLLTYMGHYKGALLTRILVGINEG